MKVSETTPRKIFGEKRAYTVPLFQRRYAWKEKNFAQLWSDIEALVDGTQKRHFMGTIVLQGSLSTNKQRSVIDGQQRLATFTIFLKVLHSQSKFYSPNQSRILYNRLWSVGQPRFNASLNDGDSFTYLLENPALLKSRSHGQVKSCYDYFDEK